MATDKKIEQSWEKPIHHNPTDYGITQIQAWQHQIKFLQQPTKEELTAGPVDDFNGLTTTILKLDYYQNKILTTSAHEQELWQLLWLMAKAQQDKRLNRITQLKQLITNPDKYNKQQSFDIPYLKSIPINTLHEILPSGFFVHNPLRNEQSPSNSLHWNKSTNRWTDYASGDYGDCIDLTMKINNCDFIQACKILNNN